MRGIKKMEQELKVTKKDSKILMLIIISLNLIIILMLSIGLYFLGNRLNELKVIPESNLPAFEETEPKPNDTFTLKEYNGKIGVYQNDSLVYTLDVYIFTLPEKDKKLLNDGITFSNIEELYMAIEEYY